MASLEQIQGARGEETCKGATGYNPQIAGMVAQAKDVITVNSYWYGREKWNANQNRWMYYQTGLKWNANIPASAYANILLGKCTGYTSVGGGAQYYEVRLWNPHWDKAGLPNYYVMVSVGSLTLLQDSGNVNGRVYRDMSYRDGDGWQGKQHDASYKNVCYDADFAQTGHWSRTDNYFGANRWWDTSGYLGDDYDYREGRKFQKNAVAQPENSDYLYVLSGADLARLDVKPLWAGDSLLRCGYAYSKTTAEPTVSDSVTENSERTFAMPSELRGLTPGSNYHVRAFQELANGTIYYSEVIDFTTKSAYKKPNIANSGISLVESDSDEILQNPTRAVIRALVANFTVLPSVSFGQTVQELPHDGNLAGYGFYFGLTKQSAVQIAANLVQTTDGITYIGTTQIAAIPSGKKIYAFQAALPALEGGTEYYCASYATNEGGTTLVEYLQTGEFWGFGASYPFKTAGVSSYAKPICTPTKVAYADRTSAIVYGAPYKGTEPLIEAGLLFSDSTQTPTLANHTLKKQLNITTKLGVAQKVELTLEAGRSYACVGYATDSRGTYYSSPAVSFMTAGIDLQLLAITSATKDSGMCAVNILNTGMLLTRERGVCWSEQENPTILQSHNSAADTTPRIGGYETTITGLQPNKTYYVRAYVKSDDHLNTVEDVIIPGKYFYSNQQELRTGDVDNETGELRMYIGAPVEVGTNSAKVTITVENPDNMPITETGVAWYRAGNVSAKNNLADYDGHQATAVGSAATLSGFNPGDIIFVQSYATSTGALTTSRNVEKIQFKEEIVTPPVETPPTEPVNPTPVGLLNFPPAPIIGQIYTYNSKKWVWNGTAWEARRDSDHAAYIQSLPVRPALNMIAGIDSNGKPAQVSIADTIGNSREFSSFQSLRREKNIVYGGVVSCDAQNLNQFNISGGDFLFLFKLGFDYTTVGIRLKDGRTYRISSVASDGSSVLLTTSLTHWSMVQSQAFTLVRFNSAGESLALTKYWKEYIGVMNGGGNGYKDSANSLGLNADILPESSLYYNLGSNGKRWNAIYVNEIHSPELEELRNLLETL